MTKLTIKTKGKVGWPKGKKRGPRKPTPPPGAGTPLFTDAQKAALAAQHDLAIAGRGLPPGSYRFSVKDGKVVSVDPIPEPVGPWSTPEQRAAAARDETRAALERLTGVTEPSPPSPDGPSDGEIYKAVSEYDAARLKHEVAKSAAADEARAVQANAREATAALMWSALYGQPWNMTEFGLFIHARLMVFIEDAPIVISMRTNTGEMIATIPRIDRECLIDKIMELFKPFLRDNK